MVVTYDDDNKKQSASMPIVLRLSYFQHYYPNAYRREDYPTSDKIIPFKLFNLMYAATVANTAQERVNMGLAVMMGKMLCENPNRFEREQLVKQYINEGYGIFK